MNQNERPNLIPIPAEDSSSGLTRRRFLKRTGGATLATMTSWSILATTANAEDHTCNQSCPEDVTIYEEYKITDDEDVPVTGVGELPEDAMKDFHANCLKHPGGVTSAGNGAPTPNNPFKDCPLKYSKLPYPRVYLVGHPLTLSQPWPVPFTTPSEWKSSYTFKKDQVIRIVYYEPK